MKTKIVVKIDISEDGARCGSSVQCQCLTSGGEFCQAFFCAIKNYKRCQKCIDAEQVSVNVGDITKRWEKEKVGVSEDAKQAILSGKFQPLPRVTGLDLMMDEVVREQKNLDPEIGKIIDEHFWDMIDGKDNKKPCMSCDVECPDYLECNKEKKK